MQSMARRLVLAGLGLVGAPGLSPSQVLRGIDAHRREDVLGVAKDLPGRPPAQIGLGGMEPAAAAKFIQAGIESGDVSKVVAHYQAHHPRARPGEKEKKLIRARLKDGYSVADLCRAIDGNHNSPHHRGENPTGKTYHRLELIMRDSSKVADFLEMADQDIVPSQEAHREARMFSNWMKAKERQDGSE